MAEYVWIKTAEQVHELVMRYGITVLEVGIFGDDIGFTTRDKVFDKPDFFRDFVVDGIERLDDGRLHRVFIYPGTRIPA